MQTVIEMPSFTRQADALFGGDERIAVIDFLANNPEAGDVIPGTSGIREGPSAGVR